MSIRNSTWVAAIAGAGLLFANIGEAGMAKQVIKAMKGKILITEAPLPDGDGEDAKATLKTFKGLTLKAVTGTAAGEVKAWTFHYTAFLKTKPTSRSLTFDFHKVDKAKTYVANKKLDMDPGSTILSGRIDIDEDEGPTAGTTYDIVLRGKRGKKEIVLARTRLTLK